MSGVCVQNGQKKRHLYAVLKQNPSVEGKTRKTRRIIKERDRLLRTDLNDGNMSLPMFHREERGKKLMMLADAQTLKVNNNNDDDDDDKVM